MIASEQAPITAQLKPWTPLAPSAVSSIGARPPASESSAEQEQAAATLVGDRSGRTALPPILRNARKRDRVCVDNPLQFPDEKPLLDWI